MSKNTIDSYMEVIMNFNITSTSALLSFISACAFTSVSFVTFPPKKVDQKSVLEHNTTKAPCTNVIFDLNGVLFGVSKKRALGQLGLFNMISYTFSGKKSDDLRKKMFDILYLIGGESPQYTENQTTLAPMHKGKKIPKIMCEWMKGTVSTEEIINKTNAFVTTLDDTFFHSSLEKKLIKKIIKIMFNTKIRCKLYKPIKTGINLVKKCKKLGHKVILLSNMDSELIPLLQKKYPHIFDQFDGTVISANVGMMKPYQNIYAHTLKTYSLDPKSTYFFDDEAINIVGAEKTGITGIHFNNPKPKKLHKKLTKLGMFVHQA